jgi:SAM-dependent MidA family methyltransferase
MARAASPILDRLLQAAGKAKRLRFDEFQAIVLYDPEYGYFSRSSERAGRGGDFVTSPETSPLFAQCIAQVLQDDASVLGADEFHLIELGAGRGTFAHDLWDALRFQPLSRRIHFHLVEQSQAARDQWRAALASIPADRIHAYATEADVPEGPWEAGAFFANELFDNVPVRRVMQTDTLHEIVLRIRPSGVREELVEAPIELAAYLEAQGVHLAVGQSAEVGLEAPRLLSRVLSRFRRGSVIVFDYGDDARHLYDPEQFPNGTLAAHRGHATHTDFYRDLGEQDLTAHVNFTPLRETLEAAGYKQLFFGTQSKFLLANGLAESMQKRLEKTADDFERLRLTQRAKQLYHPEAMGEAFRVIHARTP